MFNAEILMEQPKQAGRLSIIRSAGCIHEVTYGKQECQTCFAFSHKLHTTRFNLQTGSNTLLGPCHILSE